MALVTFDQIARARASAYRGATTKTATVEFSKKTRQLPMDHQFDVFLSHSYNDARLDGGALLGVKALLEVFSYEVYVDWIIDEQLNRAEVSAKTANTLIKRMDNSRCLLFVTSTSSQNSRWMPWELGYKHGQTSKNSDLGKVAILPITSKRGQKSFNGQEYLGIYPYVDIANTRLGNSSLWVRRSPDVYVTFNLWLNDIQPYRHV